MGNAAFAHECAAQTFGQLGHLLALSSFEKRAGMAEAVITKNWRLS
jgi:hypothetical protein